MAASQLQGRQTVEREAQFWENFSMEAEEQPLLEAVIRKCLVKRRGVCASDL
jgi:hypothetical protein